MYKCIKFVYFIIIYIQIFILLFSFQKQNKLYNRKNLRKTKEEESKDMNDDIVIIHTNDVHVGMMDNIGYNGLLLYKKELHKKYKNVIKLM